MRRLSLVLLCLAALSGCASYQELKSPCACAETAVNPVG